MDVFNLRYVAHQFKPQRGIGPYVRHRFHVARVKFVFRNGGINVKVKKIYDLLPS